MSDLADAAKKRGGNMKMFGIFTMILGLFVMMVPGLMGMSMLWLVGLMVAVAGVFRMMWAFKSESLGGGMFVFAIGVLTLLAGLAIMGNPLFASGMVTLILVGYLLLDGITEIMASFSLRPEPGSGWMPSLTSPTPPGCPRPRFFRTRSSRSVDLTSRAGTGPVLALWPSGFATSTDRRPETHLGNRTGSRSTS